MRSLPVCLCCYTFGFAFVVAGGQCEQMQVACYSQQDLQDWLDLLTKQTHTPATPAHLHKPQSVCHTVRITHLTSQSIDYIQMYCSHTVSGSVSTLPSSFCFCQLPSHPVTPSRHSESHGGSAGHTYHTLPYPSSCGTAHSGSPMWGPLEPPSTPQPWSLSCLRPAPPLLPSAALCQKEVLYIGILKGASYFMVYCIE